MKKRLLGVLLAICMVLSMLPAAAFAASSYSVSGVVTGEKFAPIPNATVQIEEYASKEVMTTTTES